MEVKSIKKDKIEEFLKDFHDNAEKWYNKQNKEDFCFDEETQLSIIDYCGSQCSYCVIRFIKNPTKEACLKSIKMDGYSIKFIKNQTEEMYLEAVKRCGNTIKYIENPTEEMKLEAVKQNGDAIKYIKNPSKQIQLEAIKNSKNAIDYIENPTYEIKAYAIEYKNYKYIDEFFNENTKLKILKENGSVIKYIKNPTKEMEFEAIRQNPYNIDYINNPSEEVCLEAIKIKYDTINFIDKKFITQSIVDTFFEMCDKKGYKYTDIMNSYFYNIPKKFINKKYALIMIDVDPENVNILRKDLRDEIVNEKDWLKKYVEYDSDDFLE